MISLNPKNLTASDLHGYLLGSIGPRPIALASTIDKNGKPNLSPFSFFNAFSAKPPICIFSPARRVRDNTIKHTLENCLLSKEVVINIVTYEIVQQTSLSSTEYDKGINEFTKAGFTEIPSELITPPRVKESPIQLECKVNDIIHLGNEGGAGNLVICEILLIHIKDSVLNTENKIDPDKLDLVGRLGGNWYTRANKKSLFQVEKPLKTKGIGIDSIPNGIKNSLILSGNDLGKLGNVEKIPGKDEMEKLKQTQEIQNILSQASSEKQQDELLHKLAKKYLEKNDIHKAWLTLLINKLK